MANEFRYGQRPKPDPLSEQGLRSDNRKQFMLDALRNATGVPEVALTMGTSLADMAGTGLGTLAGMAKQKLSGEKVNLEAATDTLQEGKFTFQPRSKGAQETLGGLATVTEPLEKGAQWAGQKTADVTGSPAAGAAVYTGLNILDPELLGPAAAKIAALRGGQNAAKWAAQTASPLVRKGSPTQMGNQTGAYTREDLAEVEGDYSFKSPTMQAFDKLKKQEQGRVSGRQLAKALQREGAKKEELYWMGLDKVLDTDELLNTADVRRLADENKPEFEFKTQRGGEPDEDAINEKVSELVSESDSLEYPENYYLNDESYGGRVQNFRNNRARDRVFESESDVQEYIDAEVQAAYDDYLTNEAEHTDADVWDAMDDSEKEAAAQEYADQRSSELTTESETDYEGEATNYDDVYSSIHDEVTGNPSSYGLEGGKPDYGEYTVDEVGSEAGANYGVSVGRLVGEKRFNRGPQDPSQEMMRADDQAAGAAEPPAGTMPSRPYQIEALRRQALVNDPNRAAYMKADKRSHYKDLGSNQMFFTRETDRYAPEWGSVQQGIGRDPGASDFDIIGDDPELKRPVRAQEEAQSDWYQAGRKTGWSDEKGLAKGNADRVDEQGRVKAFQEQALGEMPTALDDRRVKDFLAELRTKAQDNPDGSAADQVVTIQEAQEKYDQRAANPEQFDMGERISAARNLWNSIYRAADPDSEAEAFANQMRDGLDRLPTISRSPIEVATASGPMRETSQWRKLALIDSLRRAVKEGQQYFTYTPGDIHAKRWGTDSVQYAADPTEAGAGKVRWTAGGEAARGAPKGTSALQALQAQADILPTQQEGQFKSFDPYAEDAQAQMKQIVEGRLNYGMSEYPNPDAQMEKRAAALLAQFRSMVPPGGMGPHRPPTHYSPRAHGTVAAYDPIEQDLADIFKQSGSDAQLRDFENTEADTRGFEFDPALAQALKKGMLLPY